MKSIKLSDYFKIVNPEYIYLKLTPTNSIRNYDSGKIAKTVASLHKTLLRRIHKHNKQYFFEVPTKVAYYIYMEKGKVEFYFIVPENHLYLIKEKIGDTWKGITITETKDTPTFSEKAIRYYLTYKKEDALSLAVDRRTNALLSSVLNVLEVIEEGDKVGVFYNFIPTNQNSWYAEYQHTMDKLKDNLSITRQKLSITYLITTLLNILSFVLDSTFEMLEDFLGGSLEIKKNLSLTSNRKLELLPATLRKQESTVIKTQILAIAESPNPVKASNNVKSVCESFNVISGDNELIYKRHTRKFKPNSIVIRGADTIKTTPDECQNFIALPGRELLEEHNVIEKIDTFQSEVPPELRKGVMCIGENTYRGNVQKAYLSNDREYRNLSLVIIGPTRAGKSTLLSNLAKDAIDNGECTIIFDFCGNCELSNEVSSVFPKHKVLNIDCSNPHRLQGLGYNEVRNEGKSIFETYRNAKVQTMQLLTLVNSINAADRELSAKMDRYLESAALIVFINNGSIKDVFSTLMNHKIRNEFISKIPVGQKNNLEEYVLSLRELDEVDRNGEVTGTRTSAITGIIDRINRLKQNAYMELMLKKDCSRNIDLVNEMQKNQLICLRMPEVMFATETEKDIYCTYWITKIWLALQIRKWEIHDAKKHTKVNIIVDELYQVPQTQDFIRSKLSQMAKFSGKMIISCHYLGQIGIIRNELKAANASYMLISGCNKDNFNELKDELYPYTIEDLLNLKRYHSLNLIKINDGYAKFITRLPKPIK